MKSELLLDARSVSLTRGDRMLFDRLNLSVYGGEAVYIQGANGVGKTSLLKVLGGLLATDQGKVDRIVDIRFIGHQNPLIDELTVYEAMQWFALMFNGRQQSIEEALRFFAMWSYRDRRCLELSMGQRRLCCLASLMLSDHALWLLDEPFATLGKEAVASLVALLDRHVQQGGGLVYTDHQQAYGKGKIIHLGKLRD